VDGIAHLARLAWSRSQLVEGRSRAYAAAVASQRAPSAWSERERTTVAIHLLGRPRVEINGREAPRPRGRKVWGILALLLLSEGPIHRDRLASLLFADADDPLSALRWSLAELRRLLGPGVMLGGDPIILDLPPDAFVDVRTLASGTWVEAAYVPGIGHELLEGVDVHAEAAFETWLLTERRRVANLSAAVLREAATARLAAGHADAAVELATKLVAADGYDEEAQALLVRALVAAGQAPRARRYLQETIERIQRELGVEPSQALQHAAHAVDEAVPGPLWIRGTAAVESLITAGDAAIGAGVFEAGIETLRRSVADARETHDRGLEARALAALGTAFVHGARGRDVEGATVLHEALAVAEEVSAHGLVAVACRELGYIEMKRARYERADAWLARSEGIAPDRDSRAAAVAIHGAVASDRGRTVQAIERLSSAAADARALDKPRLEAWALAFLGRSHLLRQEWEPARSALTQGIAVARSAGWTTFLPFLQSLLAEVDLAEARIDQAAASFEAAFALGCQIGDPCWEGMAARGIGLIYATNGRIDEAIAWLDDARTRCMRIADAYLWVQAYCLDALCGVGIKHKRPEARAWVDDLETLAARTGMSEMLVRAHLHRTALGDRDAVETAILFADRIDNPAVLRGISSAAS
jgi:DNA-binding SARP family transcriptional activator